MSSNSLVSHACVMVFGGLILNLTSCGLENSSSDAQSSLSADERKYDASPVGVGDSKSAGQSLNNKVVINKPPVKKSVYIYIAQTYNVGLFGGGGSWVDKETFSTLKGCQDYISWYLVNKPRSYKKCVSRLKK